MLAVSDLTVRYAGNLVLDRISFIVNRGQRVGLVGPNGVGKSTLLALLAGEINPDSGSVTLAPKSRIGYLRQGFADLPGATLGNLLDTQLDGLLASFAAVHRATEELAATQDERALQSYDGALSEFDRHGGYGAIDQIVALLDRLGLSDLPFDTPLTHLSGGQKTRAGLAAILAAEPDLLLLDEPTNHLDLDALDWLSGFLADFRGAALLVSHDRSFLDQVVGTIFELDPTTPGLVSYTGGYSTYLATKRATQEALTAAHNRQRREIERVERDIHAVAAHAIATERTTQHDYIRGRAKKVARTAKVRERKLERFLDSSELIARPARLWGLALDFGDAPESGRDVVVVDNVEVQLGGRRILHGIDLHLRSGERVALTGPNGGGKSTLLRAIAGEIPVSAGVIRLGPSAVLGRFAQEQETVALDQTVLDQTRAVASMSESEIRDFLHLFLFSGETVFRRAIDLSYGERARLALAKLALRGANFLLLDEPLNHLDLGSRERFEEALSSFSGSLLMVSHDRYAIDRIATRVLELRDGQLKEVD